MTINNKEIYSMSKTGKILVWKASLNETPNSDEALEITITSGQLTGKHTTKVRYVSKGKNIGRSNETSKLEQATLELERLYQTQHDKGYKDSQEDVCINKSVDDISKPMLADKYPEKLHKLPTEHSDISLQPKIDGLRCFIQKIEDGSIRFTSRSGKVFNPVATLTSSVQDKLSIGDIMDGELYIHGKPLQEIMSIVSPTKNIKEEAQKDLHFYWYDFIPKDRAEDSYKDRFINCALEFEGNILKLEVSEYDPENLEEIFEAYMEAGYEGMMLRDNTAPYYFGRRSTSLLKYKKMQTEEFEILDILESDNDEAPRFVCDLRNEQVVTVRLKGDKEENLIYLSNKEDYIGKWMTIKFQIRTPTGSLQFPVGVGIREGEVINNEFIPST